MSQARRSWRFRRILDPVPIPGGNEWLTILDSWLPKMSREGEHRVQRLDRRREDSGPVSFKLLSGCRWDQSQCRYVTDQTRERTRVCLDDERQLRGED